MYEQNNQLYRTYLAKSLDGRLSHRLPDLTVKTTLELLAAAANCCEHWNSFLDIGAGSGRYSIALLSRFQHGTAIEATPDPELVTLGKDANYTLHTGFFADISLSEQFDLIFMGDVFEHIPPAEIPAFVVTLSSLQEAGGVIHLLTPNALFCGPASASEIYFAKNDIGHHGHYKHYLPNEIADLFSPLGYEVIWQGYEESHARQWLRALIYRFSTRDRRYSRSAAYRLISAPAVALLRAVFALANLLVGRIERARRSDRFSMRTLTMILKKK